MGVDFNICQICRKIVVEDYVESCEEGHEVCVNCCYDEYHEDEYVKIDGETYWMDIEDEIHQGKYGAMLSKFCPICNGKYHICNKCNGKGVN